MNTPTCTNCGLPNAAGAFACARCGAPLGVGAPPPNWGPPPGAAPAASGRSTIATVAIVLGVLFLVGIAIVGVIAAIAIPSLLKARAAANESAAVGVLRMIASAEASYAADHQRFGGLADLRRDGLVDPSLTNGTTRNAYRFREVHVSDTSFEFSAEPSGESGSGARSFNVTQDYTVRFVEGTVPPRGTSGQVLGE